MWAPLRDAAFRYLWIAVFVSNIGTWMQTVGAQWLLVDHPNASTLVALVQTMTALPVLLLSLPAGVLADSFDRRHLLLAVQGFQVLVAAALAVLAAIDRLSPTLLLTLTFVLGCGAAVTMPAWQAVIPDLVRRDQLPSAAALGAVSMNLARAIGPAVAGVLAAGAGVAAVFAINAVTFLVFAVALLLWRSPPSAGTEAPEPFMAALRASGRYVRHSPVMRRILLRSVLFIAPATALWALLPLVARDRLGMGASGYGLLLAALGLGAVVGAFVLPHIRARLSSNVLLLVGGLLYAAVLAVLALTRQAAVAVAVLIPAGIAWVAVLSSINAAIQMFLPRWVRARGLSAHQVVFFGGQALGGVLWGFLAQGTGLVTAVLTAALVTALCAATVPLWPLHKTAHLNREPAVYWPEPQLALEPRPSIGPVLVIAAYIVPPANQQAFLEVMRQVRLTRLRTGATRWNIYVAGEELDRFVEVYSVSSWDEHLRQHGGRLTGSDAETERHARALADGEPLVWHLFPAQELADLLPASPPA